jgi:general stress protein YciG
MPQNNINENQGASQDPKRQHDVSQPQSGGKKSNRGFASMDAAKQKEIASKGGRAAHQKGTAHQFTSDEAREAGRKGGGTVSQDRTHMAEIGRIGGQSRGRRMQRSGTGSEPPSAGTGEETAIQGEESEGKIEAQKSEYQH